LGVLVEPTAIAPKELILNALALLTSATNLDVLSISIESIEE
jgi:hypothetical protein